MWYGQKPDGLGSVQSPDGHSLVWQLDVHSTGGIISQDSAIIYVKNQKQNSDMAQEFYISGRKVLWPAQFQFISLVISKDFKIQDLSWAILAPELLSP